MSKQTLLTQGAGWFDLAQLAAPPAAPAAGDNRLYVDTGGLLQLTSPAGSQPTRRVVTDWGVGTAFPSTGLGRGDVYTHSGIGCMFLWNGAMWRQATPITAGTLAQLQASSTTYGALLHDGVRAYVTGIKAPYLWDAATGTWMSSAGGILGYAYATAAQNGSTDGSAVLVSFMRIIAPLTAGRAYRVLGGARTSNATAGKRSTWATRVAAGNAGAASTAQAVASVMTYHAAAGGAGQQDVTISGTFTVAATGTFSIDSYLSGDSGGTPAITTDSRGRFDMSLDDAGPVAAGLSLITI